MDQEHWMQTGWAQRTLQKYPIYNTVIRPLHSTSICWFIGLEPCHWSDPIVLQIQLLQTPGESWQNAKDQANEAFLETWLKLTHMTHNGFKYNENTPITGIQRFCLKIYIYSLHTLTVRPWYSVRSYEIILWTHAQHHPTYKLNTDAQTRKQQHKKAKRTASRVKYDSHFEVLHSAPFPWALPLLPLTQTSNSECQKGWRSGCHRRTWLPTAERSQATPFICREHRT